MTVKAAKAVIARALEDLHAQGVHVRGIGVDWSSNVLPEDKETPDVAIRCKIALEADL